MKLIVLKNQVPINQFDFQIDSLEEMNEIYVGRSEDCHVIIDDPLISRHHFVLKNEGSRWFFEKLSSLGVITVDGVISNRLELTNSHEIKFASYAVFIQELTPTLKQEVPQKTPLREEGFQAGVENNYTGPLDSTEVLDTAPVIEEVVSSGDENSDSLNSLDSIAEEEESNFIQEENSESDESGFQSTENNFSNPEEFPQDQSLDVVAGEEGYQEEDREEGTRVFQTFLHFQLVLFGDNIPYDRFSIEDDEVFIGRDKNKCKIFLDDPEVSSVHAVLRKRGNDFSLEDLNSSNGTILNGERINKAQVHTGDDFIIGGTTFTLEVKSDLLDSELDRLMPVESGQFIETEEIVEEEVAVSGDDGVSFDSDAPQEKSIIKRIWKNPAQRKKAIYAIAGIAMIWLILGEEDPNIEAPKTAENKEEKVTPDGQKKVDDSKKAAIKLSPDQENKMNIAYELGVSFFEQSKYFEAHKEFQTVVSFNPEHKKVQSYLEQTKEAMKRIEELEKEKREEAERIEKKKKVEGILVKAREAVKEKQVKLAESLFSQVIELDPENLEVAQLKLELDAWQKEQERIALEEAAKVAARKKMVDDLAPGKTSYLKKEWYKAILRLEEFMLIKGVDEDLVKEGSDMLSDAKNQLASEIGPVLGKARSLKEGQDLKNAYEAFQEVLLIEPTNREALNEVDDIKMQLEMKSRKIYREAIISESLSLFSDAKEKFQEVQQISPTDSEYYKKAKEKLRNYLE
jgi:pSer/pThr/pTyr-binding forkhead associated (FHA) protein